MKIIKAVNYGTRTVLQVCHNPDAPEWVHEVGAGWLNAAGLPMLDAEGHPVPIVSAMVPAGETGETCYNCRYNWDVTEVIFDGSDLFSSDIDGDPVRFTDEQLAALAFSRAAKPAAPIRVVALEGLEG